MASPDLRPIIREAMPDTNGSTEGTERALVADDDPTILLLLEHVLEGLGRPYDAVGDGSEAWREWEAKRHPLVILDIEMPGMNGLDVCRRIREADRDRATFVLIVTGRDRAADLEAVLEAGADDYVTKPTTGQHLVARLRIAQRRMADDRAHRAAEQEVQRSRWLAGIGETTVALQHEINNPLASILATAELLKIEAEDRAQAADELNTIIAQAQRIGALVKRIGDLRDARAVEYTPGSTMIDLRKEE